MFTLPWLRGYGNVKSLHVAYQETPALRQTAQDLIGQGWIGILGNFDQFMAQWTGLTAAHQAQGVTRTTLSTEDKAWMLETLTGQDVQKSAIEAAHFGAITPGVNRLWNTSYINSQWDAFVQREAVSFAVQTATQDWLKGAYYSLNLDRFVALDTTQVQQSLLTRMNATTDKEAAAFEALAISRLKQDGVTLDGAALKQGVAGSAFETVFDAVLDDVSGRLYGQTDYGTFSINTGKGVVAWGMGGNDYLGGSTGDDVLDGGAGTDLLYGGIGNDVYSFGRGYGQDTISDSDVTIGNVDIIRMAPGVAPGDVAVTRDQWNLYLSLNGGADKLTLMNWFSYGETYRIERVVFDGGTEWVESDLVSRITVPAGTEENDGLFGSDYSDSVDGLGGNDQIFGYSGNDTLIGNSGNDTLDGGDGDDILDGGQGDDSLTGGQGNDTYRFGNGSGHDVIVESDWTTGNSDTVRIVGAVLQSDVTVTRDWGNLYLSLNGGVDRLTLKDWFHGKDKWIERVVFDDQTEWGVSDLISRITVPPGTGSADSLYGSESGDVIDGFDGNDSIYGYGENDVISGGTGNDTLYGDSGDDVLDGGVGNDFLHGESGNDTFVFGNGYGLDVISDADGTEGNTDTVRMLPGVLPGDVTVTRDQFSLYLSLNGGADKLTLVNWFSYGDTYKIERAVFDDGTVWNTADFLDHITVPDGTPGNDGLYGGNAADTLIGLDGNDQLDGGAGNDRLDGGAGNDSLAGGSGNDTYVFGNGYGQDIISENDLTIGNVDTIQLTVGVTPDGITVTRDQGNLYLSLNGGADKLTLENWFSYYGEPNKIERVTFDDGTEWTASDLVNRITVPAGTEGEDRLFGSENADTLAGSGGNDDLFGEGGADTLDGGAGNDSLNGGLGNDTYVFGNGYGQDIILNDDQTIGSIDTIQMAPGIAPSDVTVTRDRLNLYLSLNGGSDKLKLQNWFSGENSRIALVIFDNGMTWNSADILSHVVVPDSTSDNDSLFGSDADDVIEGRGGNDLLYGYGGNDTLLGGEGSDAINGGDGDDTLIGGEGNDTLNGDAGNDTYVFGSGYGQDVISDVDWTTTDIDTIQLAPGVIPSDLTVTRDGSDLFLSLNGGADKLTLRNWFISDSYKIERVVFDDQTEWTAEELASRITVPVGTEGDDTLFGSEYADVARGESGNDTISGFGGNDLLSGGAGNDQLEGGVGNDLLDGGAGNDILNGGIGDDTYVFGSGSGQDVISDDDWTVGNIDTITMSPGVTPGDVMVTRDRNNLYLGLNGGADKLTLLNWVTNDSYKVERVVFEDQTEWTPEELARRIAVPESTTADDNLYGSGNADVIDGIGGNDQILGYGGNDTLRGGEGNDILFGEDGNDTLIGGLGADSLDGGAGDDTYLFAIGDGQDTISSIDVSTGKHDVIVFASGIQPTDVVATRSGDDLILSIQGTQDQLTVQNYFQASTEANPEGIEAIRFADGTTWGYADVSGEGGPIVSDDGDSIVGYYTDDVLNGAGGNDSLWGMNGNDTLDGGVGDDTLEGGSGNDTYRFGRGGGQDTVLALTEVSVRSDTILFGQDVLPADITASLDGNDLVLSINGTNDALRVVSWFDGLGGGIEKCKFADGTEWNYQMIKSLALPKGTEGDDYLLGMSDDDILEGLGGNDQIYGGPGDDTLDGGAGNDQLAGGLGQDIFRFGRGSGEDFIWYPKWEQFQLENDPSAGKDVIELGADVAPEDVEVYRQWDDLYLGIRGTGDVLRVSRHFEGDGPNKFSIAEVRFSDGTKWDFNAIEANLTVQPGTADNDFLYGGSGNEVLSGLGGDDVLDGGAGDDILMGGEGNDTYQFGIQSGHDIIVEAPDQGWGNYDTVKFGPGISSDMLHVKRYAGDGNDLQISVDGSSATLTIKDYFSDTIPYGGVDAFVADGYAPIDVPIWANNDAPTLTTGLEPQETKAGQLFSWQIPDGAFIDPNGDRIYYNVTLTNGDMLPEWLSFDYASRQFVGTPGNGDLGILDIQITASDGDSASVTSSFRLAIVSANNAPTVSEPISGITLLETDTLSAVIPPGTFLDADAGDTLVLSATLANGDPLPSWITFNPITGTFSGTPGVGNLAELIIRLTATDHAGANVSTDIALSVVAAPSMALVGTAAADTLHGLSGNDTLDGGAGADTLIGGKGNDTYFIDNAKDKVVELSGEGNDTVVSVISTTLAANVENLVLSGTANLSGTGNELNNVLTGNGGANVLNGGLGADTMVGGVGNDTYYVDNASDSVVELVGEGTDKIISSVSYTLSDNVENLTLSGIDAINGTGNDLANAIVGNAASNTLSGLGGNDILTGGASDDVLLGGDGNDSLSGLDGDDALDGGAGNDTLNGGLGSDAMTGGAGNDTYYVDSSGDSVVEQVGEGTDKVVSTISYTLADNVENLTLSGTDAINGTGNDLANAIAGNTASNTLSGLGGNDTLTGGASNDVLLGGDGNDSLSGVDGDDALDGGSGNDTLNGGLGADTMAGGADNDTYYVDNVGDSITELSGEGTDRVISTISYTLGDNLENLTLSGSDAINGTGNDLANAIVGNTASNTLSGLGGNDTLTGGASNDILLGGDGNDSLSGVDGDDALEGGSGNDTLNGGLGADTMSGGLGDDTYYVDNAGDALLELFGEGTDRAISTISYTLGANLENLTLSGTLSIDGFGNGLDNSLTGNAADNLLNGGSGNDVLNGGAGQDVLEGLDGNDTLTDTSGIGFFAGGTGNDKMTGGVAAGFYVGGSGNDTISTGDGNEVIAFNQGDGYDTITMGGNSRGTVSLGGGIAYADLRLRKSGNDLVLETGAGEGMAFRNWYATSPVRNVVDLQVIAEAMAQFDASSSDPLLNKKVDTFDFHGLVTAFDAARAATPTLTSWSLVNAFVQNQLSAGDDSALGGDLAYQYGKNGTLAGIGLTAAQAVLGDTGFGTQSQVLRPLVDLQSGQVRLS
ncbi:MAG: hypothetical protein EG824_07760 [Deltaproteobacteria bacterium]|nr:hypothetical protein [Deltaproteobacteria bacterium]